MHRRGCKGREERRGGRGADGDGATKRAPSAFACVSPSLSAQATRGPPTAHGAARHGGGRPGPPRKGGDQRLPPPPLPPPPLLPSPLRPRQRSPWSARLPAFHRWSRRTLGRRLLASGRCPHPPPSPSSGAHTPRPAQSAASSRRGRASARPHPVLLPSLPPTRRLPVATMRGGRRRGNGCKCRPRD